MLTIIYVTYYQVLASEQNQKLKNRLISSPKATVTPEFDSQLQTKSKQREEDKIYINLRLINNDDDRSW